MIFMGPSEAYRSIIEGNLNNSIFNKILLDEKLYALLELAIKLKHSGHSSTEIISEWR